MGKDYSNITFNGLPNDDPFKKYLIGWEQAADKDAYDEAWQMQHPITPIDYDVNLYNPNLGPEPIERSTDDVALADMNNASRYDNVSYFTPNPAALSANDPRVKAMKQRQLLWQNLQNNNTLKPINSDDPRVKAAKQRALERTYNSYYKKLNNNKPFNPNWNSPKEMLSLPETRYKNGGELHLDYRSWEKEMYDSYKCGGKSKKKSCGGIMNPKKKACSGMKVKK